jgi:cysteinyl-tRNA synthetase
MPLHLYNTLTRRVEPFRPGNPGEVTFYSCGPTVYDDAHIGNFRAFLAADLLRRWIESPLCELEGDTRPERERARGRRVVHVMNITDVGHMTEDDRADGGGEDKMEAAARRLEAMRAGAKKSGTAHAAADLDPHDPYAIAGYYAERFMEDARKLGLKVAIEAERDPSLMPRATEHVRGMIAMIERLIERGFAYRAGEAVYFDVQRFSGYGALSGNTLDELRGGAGGRVSAEHQAGKRHPADFLLWKADPGHIMKWDSPWGAGYPGWHIECSVMSLGRLVPGGLERVLGSSGGGFEIDLHSGGEDNIFPHHECERAQSCACTGGERFSRHWFHARFLLVEGEKMSKSKGNFFTARDLFAKGHEPAAVRLELIKTHYRANANFTEQGLKDSARRIRNYQRFARRLAFARTPDAANHPVSVHEDVIRLLPDFAEAMNSDLNIAKAISLLDIASDMMLHHEVGYDPDSVDRIIRDQREQYDRASSEMQLPEEPLPSSEIQRLREDPDRVENAWGALHLLDSILGVIFTPQSSLKETEIGVFIDVEPSDEVSALLAERREAKRAKDFARADEIRERLAGMGLSIKDVAGGKVEVSRA